MTDLEIDRALALAIGWTENRLHQHDTPMLFCLGDPYWRVFSHRDWNVIGPIAEMYNMFPYQLKIGEEREKWNVLVRGKDYVADTPQKAIALAVIGAKK